MATLAELSSRYPGSLRRLSSPLELSCQVRSVSPLCDVLASPLSAQTKYGQLACVSPLPTPITAAARTQEFPLRR